MEAVGTVMLPTTRTRSTSRPRRPGVEAVARPVGNAPGARPVSCAKAAGGTARPSASTAANSFLVAELREPVLLTRAYSIISRVKRGPPAQRRREFSGGGGECKRQWGVGSGEWEEPEARSQKPERMKPEEW